jgi:hypothetical protein
MNNFAQRLKSYALRLNAQGDKNSTQHGGTQMDEKDEEVVKK